MKGYGKIKLPVVAIWFMTQLMAVFLFFQQVKYSLVDPTDAKIAPSPLAATEQIEITPAMLKAGDSVLSRRSIDLSDALPHPEIARTVFEAMLEARHLPADKAGR
jgi:hypothetical protein